MRRLKIEHLLLLSVGAIVMAAVIAGQFRMMLAMFSVSIPMRIWFGLTFSNSMLNYLPARAGLVARAAYLNRQHGMPLGDYMTLTLSTQIVNIAIASLLGLASTVDTGVVFASSPLLWIFAGTLAAASAGFVLVVVFPIRAIGSRFLEQHVVPVQKGFALWRKRRRVATGFILLGLLLILASTLRLWMAFVAIGADATFMQVLAMQALASMSVVISIAPGNLGIHEGVLVFVGALLGMDPSVCLLAGLVDRIVVMVWVFLLGGASMLVLIREVSGAVDEAR